MKIGCFDSILTHFKVQNGVYMVPYVLEDVLNFIEKIRMVRIRRGVQFSSLLCHT